jgi:glycosyltransferase involved in cell wall biosynthesis
MSRRIDQWVPALHRGDAIGDSARLMRDTFREWGHQADVYALTVDEDLKGDGREFRDFRPGGPGDVVILHYALPSPLTDALKAHRGRRMLVHHNVTPPEYFAGWDEEMVRICALGRQQVAELSDQVDLALADSEFNRQELEDVGFTRTAVLPIYLDFEAYAQPPAPVLRSLLEDGRTNVLFVGRLAPNKRQDELIRVASAWKRFVSPDVRLLLVGKAPARGFYPHALQALAYEEGLTPAEVVFLGHVSHRELLACYAASRLFLCLSAHEGFGVPLVESMVMDLPILARRGTAVTDTLGPAGVQFDDEPLDAVAEMASMLATDEALRAGVLAGQRERRRRFAPEAVRADLRRALEAVGV